MKKIIETIFVISFIICLVLNLSESVFADNYEVISIDAASASDYYDGAVRGTECFHMYGGDGDNDYSWAEYEISVPTSGEYTFDAQISDSCTVYDIMFDVAVDGVIIGDSMAVEHSSSAYEKHEVTLHRNLPLSKGEHKIRIYQANLRATILLYRMTLTYAGIYKKPCDVYMLSSHSESCTMDSYMNKGDSYREYIQFRGGNKIVFKIDAPTGLYDISALVSASTEYDGYISVSVDGVNLIENEQINASYDTDIAAKTGLYYNELIANGLKLYDGSHTIEISSLGDSGKYFYYFRGIKIKKVGDVSEMHLYSVKDGNEVEVEYPQSGTLKVRCMQNFEHSGVMFAAVYDSGKLASLSKLMPFDTGNVDISAIVENVPPKAELKTFFWDDLKTLKPIRECGYFKQPSSDTPRDLYVATTGSDDENGSRYAPYSTIEKAKETIRGFSHNMNADVTVYIDSGEYPISDTMKFTEDDSGRNGYKIIYTALDKDNPPVISGGKRIYNWSKLSEDSKIWSAKADIADTRTLYINSKPAVRARSKYVYIPTEIINNGEINTGLTVRAVNFPRGLKNCSDIELVWNLNWTAQRTPVEQITYGDTTVNITMKQPSFNEATLNTNNQYITPDSGKNFYIENAFELLDEQGEFYFDKTTKTIYYYPFDNEDMETAEAYVGTCDFMVDASGTSKNDKIHDIVFDSISFRYGSWNELNNLPYGIYCEQADMLRDGTKPEDAILGSIKLHGNGMLPAQFAVNNAYNITISNCEFSCLGSSAISMANAVSNSEIIGNKIVDVSGSGIVIGHWNHVNDDKIPETMERCTDINVSNNVIRRAASEFMQCCGISLYYVKNVNVSNNDIRGLPYTGITLGWGWGLETISDFGGNKIVNNRIEDVAKVLEDGAHIYTLGASHDNVISGNYLVKSSDYRGGIYLDQATSGIDVRNNVVDDSSIWLNARQNVRIKDVVVEDNYFAEDSAYAWVTGTYNKDNPLGNYVNERSQYYRDGVLVDDECYNTYQNNTAIADVEQNDAAKAIMLNSGVEQEYKHLLSDVNIPKWRTDFLSTVPIESYTGTNGKVQMEDFNPIEGVGYLYQGTYKVGNILYRSDALDVDFMSYGFAGVKNCVIAVRKSGDWFTYDYTVDKDGKYDFNIMASNGSKRDVYIDIYVDDELKIKDAVLDDTGNYETYKLFNLGELTLNQGKHKIKIVITKVDGLHLDWWNISNDTEVSNDSGYDDGIIKQ